MQAESNVSTYETLTGRPDIGRDPAPRSMPARLAAYRIGFVGGVAWGVVARLWMRWISTKPEFTWSGTLGIVFFFGIFGMAQTNARASRRKDRSRWRTTVARALGWVGTMPLFLAAGGMMLPTVVFGSLATWRTDVVRLMRIGFAVLGSIVPVLLIIGFVDDFGVVGGIARGFGLIGVYAVVIAWLSATFRPRLDGWHLTLTARRAGYGSAAVLVTAIAIGTRGFG